MDGAAVAGTGARTDQAPEWRWALPRIGALFVVTRLFVIAIAFVAEATQAAPPLGIRWTDAPILASLTSWDSRYYLGIAGSGYHAAPVYGPYVDYAFFPLYPALVRIGSLLTLGNTDLAGVLVANAAFGGALVALYALSVRRLSRDQAIWSLIFLSFAPGAVAFSMAYTEGLFLLVAVGAFLAAEARRPAAMGVLFALAALTRPPGILLGLPLLVLVLRDPGMRARHGWAWLLLGPVALAGFSAYLGAVTGDPLAWVHAQTLWSTFFRIMPGPSGVTGVPAVAPQDASPEAYAAFGLWLGSLLFYMFLFVYFRTDRMPAAYWLVALLPYAGVVGVGRLLTSSTRYLAIAWPFDWTLARRRARWVRVVVPTVFLVLQGWCAWLAFTWTVHP